MHYWTAEMERADALLFGRVTDEYEFVVQPVIAGHGPTLLAGLREPVRLELMSREEFRSGAVAMRYRAPTAPPLADV